jgi:hypothetical protein
MAAPFPQLSTAELETLLARWRPAARDEAHADHG